MCSIPPSEHRKDIFKMGKGIASYIRLQVSRWASSPSAVKHEAGSEASLPAAETRPIPPLQASAGTRGQCVCAGVAGPETMAGPTRGVRAEAAAEETVSAAYTPLADAPPAPKCHINMRAPGPQTGRVLGRGRAPRGAESPPGKMKTGPFFLMECRSSFSKEFAARAEQRQMEQLKRIRSVASIGCRLLW